MHLLNGLALGLLSATSAAVQSRCGTSSPSLEFRSISENHLKQNKRAQDDRETITVKTYVHVLAADDTPAGGYYGEDIVEREMQVLNDAYAPHGFFFDLVSTATIINASWAYPDGGPDSPIVEPDMRMALKKGGYGDLDLFLVAGLVPLGRCELPLPDPTSEDILMDGCVIERQNENDPVTDPSDPFYGSVIIHEVGHWLGLLHTFDGGCSEPGDYVDDTPAEAWGWAEDGEDCPAEGRDTCPDLPGLDPVDNYMTYGFKACFTEKFTPGQEDRMHSMWHELRAPFVSNCTSRA